MPAHDEGVVDWRRLASDRNVSLEVARGLWERARASSVDPRTAERAYNQLLDVAAKSNVTHEPGRETLLDTRGVPDAASLGPGKSTLVLNERNSPTAPRPRDLQHELDDAIDAGKQVVELLQNTSPDDIVKALRALAGNTELVQQALGVAARLVKNRDDFVAKQPPPPKKKKKPEDEEDQVEEEPATESKL